MKRLASIVLVLAACGGSSKPTSSGPEFAPGSAAPDPIAEPIKPVEPTPGTTVEPAKPAEPQSPDPAKVKADLLAAEMAAFEKAKPVFDKWCAKCHTQGNRAASKKKLDHFDMTKYPFGGHHAMEMSKSIRKVLGLDGSKVTMPADKKGAVKGDELAAIAAWADAFDASHAGGAHEGQSGHDHHGGGHKH